MPEDEVLHQSLNLADNLFGLNTNKLASEEQIAKYTVLAGQWRHRKEIEPSDISVSVTSRGIWVARVTYEDNSFDLVEGHQESVLQVRHLKNAKYSTQIPGQYENASAAKAIAEYRSAPKITADEERRQETLAQFGQQSQFEELFEEREP